eukprot:m.91330 g.91330  ORF g.91330 m.91330 type:complete len:120 (-) comp12943_c0_seq1:35-394(-)
MSRFNFKSAASRSSLGPAPKLSKTVFEDSDDESGDERVAAAKSDSEEDPLDAFMAGIDQEVEANKATEGQVAFVQLKSDCVVLYTHMQTGHPQNKQQGRLLCIWAYMIVFKTCTEMLHT